MPSLCIFSFVLFYSMIILNHIFMCTGKSFSPDVVSIFSLSLLQGILKEVYWCKWTVVSCALGLIYCPYMMFVSGLHIRFITSGTGWEVS